MINKMLKWWLSINWKTRLISIMMLLLSILISTIVFLLLIHLQNELINNNLCFFRDFSSLLAYDLARLMQDTDIGGLKDFIEKIYLTTSSIDYLRLFDKEGYLLSSLPSHSSVYKSTIELHVDMLDLKYYVSFCNILRINNYIDIVSSTVDCSIPLVSDHEILGFLQLGLKFNKGIISINRLARSIGGFVFVIVWLLFILGIAFNFFIIMEPINQLSIGIHKVSFGVFDQTLKVSSGGLFGNLLVNFNEMSQRLHSYERNNIVQLTTEKVRLEALVSTIADGAILLDTELRILLVNQVAIKTFSWSNKDLLGSIIFQHLPIHVNEALVPILNSMVKLNCFDNKNIQHQELTINLNYESLKAFRFLLSTISNYNYQSFNGVVIIIQDITRENQLNKAKNHFISNVSHELRTPLCNIGSFLETLIDYKYKLTSKQKDQFLDIAYAETQRLNSLVNDVLDLSRLESDYTYVLKPMLLTNVVVYIVQASQIIALNKKVQIMIEVHPSVKQIFAHKISLCQVLSNLISNALKFTHKEGRIVIRVYPLLIKKSKFEIFSLSSEIVRLEIIDEGIGIHKMFQRQIFDRFMRIENHVHSLQGTGLGLSIVQNIIKKHNSIIRIYSEVSIGTSFWFDLFIAT